MEIERKYLIKSIPENLDEYKHTELLQGYLSVKPVMRIRRKNDKAYFTYKGEGLLAREEIEKEISLEAFEHLLPKVDGHTIEKTRYIIPYGKYTIELDVFHGHKEGLVMAEVEFGSIAESESFEKPEWFGEEVTENKEYHNCNMI